MLFRPERRFPRPRKIRLTIGTPLVFESIRNRRHGWDEIATRARDAIIQLEMAGRSGIKRAAVAHDSEQST